MDDKTSLSFETIDVQAGHSPDPTTQSRGVPLYRTSSFVFKSAEHAKRLFALQESGNIYSRMGNPTNDVLEARVSQLEGGAASVAVASGTAAVFNTVITIAKAGDEIVSATNLYGGTYTMFDAILPDMGITTKFANALDPSAFEAAITPRTRLSISKRSATLSSTSSTWPPSPRSPKSATCPSSWTAPSRPLPSQNHRAGRRRCHQLPYQMARRPRHRLGGIVTDAGRFDWSDPKFELFNRPDPPTTGCAGRATSRPNSRTPPSPSASNRASAQPGRLPLTRQRLDFPPGHRKPPRAHARHCENALAAAKFLKSHPKVAWVRYPGLEGDPSHALAQKLLPKGSAAMVVFGVKGGGRPARSLSIRSRYSPTWPTWATPEPRHPSRKHDPRPAYGRATDRLGRHARPRAPLHRHRGRRGHPRRFGAGWPRCEASHAARDASVKAAEKGK